MNINRVLPCFLLFMLLISCSKENGGENEEELNAAGMVFMERVKERPNWESEWELILKHGEPLPGETFIIKVNDKHYYILPLHVKDDVYRVVLYPVKDMGLLDDPLLAEGELTKSDLTEETIITRVKDWEEEETRYIEISKGDNQQR